MYNIIDNIMQIPSQYANSTVTYIAGTIILLFVAILIDLIYKLIRTIIKSTERR